MTERGGWLSIQRHGLLSTSALLDLYAAPEALRLAIDRALRPASVELRHQRYGRAVVRDQTPMSEAALRQCLQGGITPDQWYAMLNSKVFFWPAKARLITLSNATLNRVRAHEVLEIDAAALVAAYRPAITLSPINSGATFPMKPSPRGPDTFLPIAEFGFGASPHRRKRPGQSVVELAIEGAVPDIAAYTRRVVLMQGSAELATVWQAPGG